VPLNRLMVFTGALSMPCLACAGGGELPDKTKVIVSYHDFEATPDMGTLRNLVDAMFACGGHIAKVAATATDIADSMRMLDLLKEQKGGSRASAAPRDCAGAHFRRGLRKHAAEKGRNDRCSACCIRLP